MLKDFNILATTDRITESAACSELWMLLRSAGDPSPVVDRMRIWGVVAARTSLDPLKAVEAVSGLLERRERSASVLLRVMPVQRVVDTSLDAVAGAALELAAAMKADDSYRVTVEKRRTDVGSMDFIDRIAGSLPQKVRMKESDWVVLVEVVGARTGVSVVPPSLILNVQKLNARLAAEAKKRAALDKQPC